MKNFSAHNLRTYRKKNNLTLQALADKLNAISPDRKYTSQTVSNYEGGKYPLPLDTILACCQVYEIDVNEFVCEDSTVTTANRASDYQLKDNNQQAQEENGIAYLPKRAKYVPSHLQKDFALNTAPVLSTVEIPNAQLPYMVFDVVGRDMSPQLQHGDMVVAEKITIDNLMPRATCVVVMVDGRVFIRNATRHGEIITLTTYDEARYPKYHVEEQHIKEIYAVTQKITSIW